MKKELKEIEEKFNKYELQLDQCNNLEKTKKFEELVLSETYGEYNEEQMSLVIEKFFENYKYVSGNCLVLFYVMIEIFFPQLIDKFFTECFKNGNILNFIYSLYRDENYRCKPIFSKEMLTKNLLNNLSEVGIFNLLYYRAILDSHEDIEKISLELEKRFETNEKENVQQMIHDISATFCPLIKLKEHMSKKEIKEIDAINEFVYLVIKDVCRNEEVEISDIEFLGIGTTSVALGIGNKVLKLGSKRFTERFPNNPYIAPMLLRKKIVVNGDISYFIEVTERCKTNIEISAEEKNNFMKKLIELGIMCTDIYKHKANLGRVSNPDGNIVSWKEDLSLTDEVLGLDSYRGTEVLKQGDLVIIDNDCIYDISGNNVTLEDDFLDSKNSKSRSRKK